MIRKYHNHKPQTIPWHREEEPLNHQTQLLSEHLHIVQYYKTWFRDVINQNNFEIILNSSANSVESDLRCTMWGYVMNSHRNHANTLQDQLQKNRRLQHAMINVIERKIF